MRDTADTQTSNSESDRVERNRIIWHSRRGMLELDLILEPFAKHCYPRLSDGEQQDYVRLLASEDQDLFDWFLKKKPVDNPALLGIVETVLRYQASRDL